MNPPVINPTALEDAVVLIDAAREKIKTYAAAFGLPVEVKVWRNSDGLQVRLTSHLRVFRNVQGKHLLTASSARLGHELWAMIADAGNAYSARANRG